MFNLRTSSTLSKKPIERLEPRERDIHIRSSHRKKLSRQPNSPTLSKLQQNFSYSSRDTEKDVQINKDGIEVVFFNEDGRILSSAENILVPDVFHISDDEISSVSRNFEVNNENNTSDHSMTPRNEKELFNYENVGESALLPSSNNKPSVASKEKPKLVSPKEKSTLFGLFSGKSSENIHDTAEGLSRKNLSFRTQKGKSHLSYTTDEESSQNESEFGTFSDNEVSNFRDVRNGAGDGKSLHLDKAEIAQSESEKLERFRRINCRIIQAVNSLENESESTCSINSDFSEDSELESLEEMRKIAEVEEFDEAMMEKSLQACVFLDQHYPNYFQHLIKRYQLDMSTSDYSEVRSRRCDMIRIASNDKDKLERLEDMYKGRNIMMKSGSVSNK